MQPALTLTDEERLCFMQALDAVAWAVVWAADRGNDQPGSIWQRDILDLAKTRRNDQPASHWQALLRQFGSLLAVSAADHEFRAGAPAIAEKVNQIENPRARLYFLRIIHDIYRSELASLGEGMFSDAQREACRNKYHPVYEHLCAAIRLD